MSKWNPGILREDLNGCQTPNTWRNCQGDTFQVRTGPAYSKTGKKIPSEPSIYEIFAIDTYNFDSKMPHIGQYVNIPPDPHADGLPVPAVMIINLMIPSYAPSLMWSAPGDGEGWSLVFYCRLTANARDAFLNGMPSNALTLLRKFVHASPESSLRKRFKVIARVNNVNECGLNSACGSLVRKYNAKPFLARTTTSFYLMENYFEVDLDVHNFGRPARIGLHGCREVVSSLIFDCAFVIEGVDDEELPEQILMAAQFTNLDITSVPNAPSLPDTVPWKSHRLSTKRQDLDANKNSRIGESSDDSLVEDDDVKTKNKKKNNQEPPFVWRKSELPPRYQDVLVRSPLNSGLQNATFTLEGDPIEGGILMVNVDLDSYPNVGIYWFRDRRVLDFSDTLVYIPTVDDVDKRLGVAMANNDIRNEDLKPWWESDPILPAPPEAHNMQMFKCECGQDAWIEYSYFGGREGNSRCLWLRSRDGRKWEHVPEADDKNTYSCSPNELNYHLKCILTPVRDDNVKGSTVEVMEFCGLNDATRINLIEALIPGSLTFDVQILDPPNLYAGQLSFNHRYIWVMTGNGNDKHKIVSGKFKRSCRIMCEVGSDVIALLYVDKHNDKELVCRLRVPSVELRTDIVLCFRLYMAMSLEDIAPEFVGPEVYHDWYKGKFEAYRIEQTKPSLTPFLKMKPNCHHRLRLALERPPPTRVAHAFWRGVQGGLPEESISKFNDELQKNGVGWIMARDVLIAVMKVQNSDSYPRTPDLPSLDRSASVPPPCGPPIGVSIATHSGYNPSILDRDLVSQKSITFDRVLKRNTLQPGIVSTPDTAKLDVQQQIMMMQRRIVETNQRCDQLADEVRALRQDFRATRGSILRSRAVSSENSNVVPVLIGLVAFMFCIVIMQYYT